MPSDRDAGLCSSNQCPISVELHTSTSVHPSAAGTHGTTTAVIIRLVLHLADQRAPSNSNLDLLPCRIRTVLCVHILEASTF